MSSLGKAEEKLSTETAATAFQLAWATIRKFGKNIWDKATLAQSMATYAQGYLSIHGHIKVLGMSNPIALASIYPAVEVVSPGYRNAYDRIEDINRSLRDRKHVSP